MRNFQFTALLILIYTVIVIALLLLVRHWLSIEWSLLASAGAVLLAPAFALAIGNYITVRSEKYREEYETLKDLMAHRHMRGSSEFLIALNRVILVFDSSAKIKGLVKDLWEGHVNHESPLVSNRKEVDLVYAICQHMGRRITEFEIDSFFIPGSPQVILSQGVPPGNVSTSSTGGTPKEGMHSASDQSITAGSFISGWRLE